MDIKDILNAHKISVGILTVSDRCSKGLTLDESGPTLKKTIQNQGWEVSTTHVVGDNIDDIKKVLLDWSDNKQIPVILTTGGTGVGPRDLTPEATHAILDKELPGVSEFIRRQAMEVNYFAALSRGVSGVRKNSLIINFPGNPMGAKGCLLSVIGLIPNTLKMMEGRLPDSMFKLHA